MTFTLGGFLILVEMIGLNKKERKRVLYDESSLKIGGSRAILRCDMGVQVFDYVCHTDLMLSTRLFFL